ncbi:MAG: hypothetical protein QOH95_160 [Gaiellaceae bacterium]|nr:hypothetical protein [Gaiellaceae bacterium]
MARVAFGVLSAALALAAPAASRGGAAGPSLVAVELTDAKLSLRPSRVPAGPVVFRVLNKGKIARSFAIGRVHTPLIPGGRSATLRAELGIRGPQPYVSLGRRPAARLTGVLTVFVPCLSPSVSTVEVRMDHDRSGIALSRSTIPCGTVAFVVTNIGVVPDSLQVITDYPQPGASTPLLDPGKTARLIVRFTEKGIAYYMSGTFPPSEPEFGGSDADGGAVRIV